MSARRLSLVAIAGLLPAVVAAPTASAAGSQTRTCHGSAKRCHASFAIPGQQSNRKLVVRLSDTDLRLASVAAELRGPRGAYALRHGHFRLGGSEYVVTLSVAQASGRRGRLTLTFRAPRR